MKIHPKISIILCTYNGSKFIRKQIDSIIEQSYTNWSIYVSDDGSTDNTIDIVDEYKELLGDDKIFIMKGPKKGFAWNFINALKSIYDVNGMGYYAFCDQDDIWLPDKLSRSVEKINAINDIIPALYCSRTQLIDEQDLVLGESTEFKHHPSFKNALIQSIAGGNTMVFNSEAARFISLTPNDFVIPSHDWWVYQIISGVNGYIYYDKEPSILYRQHSKNIMGSNKPIKAKLHRIKMLFGGGLKDSMNNNLLLLEHMSCHFKVEHREALTKFKRIRTFNIASRLFGFMQLKLYRQSFIETLLFNLALILKRV